MGLTVKESGGSFTPCPAGTHLGVCISIYDLGTQATPFKDENTGETKYAKQVFIQWELPGETKVDGTPFVIGKFYTASLNDKANLRHDLESWRGRAFTAEELEGFSLANIVGKGCMLSVVQYTKSDGNASAKVGSVMALPKGTPTPKPQNASVIFDIDAWDDVAYKMLDEYWQKAIASSVEGKAKLGEQKTNQANRVAVDAKADANDDSIPF